MKLWINQDPFFIPSILLALTKFTLTAVLIAQFTSPHRQTLAGEGKIPPLAHLPKWQVGHSTRHRSIANMKLHDSATVLIQTQFNQPKGGHILGCMKANKALSDNVIRDGYNAVMQLSCQYWGFGSDFYWHLVFLTHTGQIRTLLYTRVPWIRSPRKCLQGDHRSCRPNEVMGDPVTKTQHRFYLLMCDILMQAANLKWQDRKSVV